MDMLCIRCVQRILKGILGQKEKKAANINRASTPPNYQKLSLSLYGAVNFSDPPWSKPLPHVGAKLPPNLAVDFTNKVYAEKPSLTESSVSLEGQTESGASKGPNFSQPRDAFAFTQIAAGTVLAAIYPQGHSSDPDYMLADPAQAVSSKFPPTYIVHGTADKMVHIELRREYSKRLKEARVKCGITEVSGVEHTFAATMKVGSQTWWLRREGFDFLRRLSGRGRNIRISAWISMDNPLGFVTHVSTCALTGV